MNTLSLTQFDPLIAEIVTAVEAQLPELKVSGHQVLLSTPGDLSEDEENEITRVLAGVLSKLSSSGKIDALGADTIEGLLCLIVARRELLLLQKAQEHLKRMRRPYNEILREYESEKHKLLEEQELSYRLKNESTYDITLAFECSKNSRLLDTLRLLAKGKKLEVQNCLDALLKSPASGGFRSRSDGSTEKFLRALIEAEQKLRRELARSLSCRRRFNPKYLNLALLCVGKEDVQKIFRQISLVLLSVAGDLRAISLRDASNSTSFVVSEEPLPPKPLKLIPEVQPNAPAFS
jgi:hypothetical protein